MNEVCNNCLLVCYINREPTDRLESVIIRNLQKKSQQKRKNNCSRERQFYFIYLLSIKAKAFPICYGVSAMDLPCVYTLDPFNFM